MEKEGKKTIASLIVTIALVSIGCFVGKLVTERIADTWIAFNGPTIGILILGELAWWRISKRIFKD